MKEDKIYLYELTPLLSSDSWMRSWVGAFLRTRAGGASEAELQRLVNRLRRLVPPVQAALSAPSVLKNSSASLDFEHALRELRVPAP